MVLRWAFAITAAVCAGIVMGSGLANAVLLIGLFFAALAFRPYLLIDLWRAGRELFDLLPGVCFDCSDGRHTACDGACACPVDHEIEAFIENARARTEPGELTVTFSVHTEQFQAAASRAQSAL